MPVYVEILPFDRTLHPLAVDLHLHAVVGIVLPHGVVLRGEFSDSPHFHGPEFRNLNPAPQLDKVRIAAHLVSSELTGLNLFRVKAAASKMSGIKTASEIMVVKMGAVAAGRIRQRIGRLSPAQNGDR